MLNAEVRSKEETKEGRNEEGNKQTAEDGNGNCCTAVMTHPRPLKDRTYHFALRVVRLCQLLPATPKGEVCGRQLLRAGTAVASNYRAACRARSRRDFIAKLGIVIEEADETAFWLQLLSDVSLDDSPEVQELRAEANELIAIFTTSQKTAVANSARERHLV